MSYKIYTTDAFIVKARGSKDMDLSLALFTEEFGMIQANAKSARGIKSKLRYSLQSLSFSSISLVKGREIWRVTSARKIIGLYDKRLPLSARLVFARILTVVERFCPVEQGELAVFSLIKEISGFLYRLKIKSDKSDKTDNDISNTSEISTLEKLEKIFLLKLMYILGYVDKTTEIKDLIDNEIAIIFASDVKDQEDWNEKAVDTALLRATTVSHL